MREPRSLITPCTSGMKFGGYASAAASPPTLACTYTAACVRACIPCATHTLRCPHSPPLQVEADARERKLREKELMIAHLHQRAEDRQDTEMKRAEELDKQLADLEVEEYKLLVALDGHKMEREAIHREYTAREIGSKAALTLQKGQSSSALSALA